MNQSQEENINILKFFRETHGLFSDLVVVDFQ